MSAFRGMRFWVGLSVALHLAALLFLILDFLPRRIPEPEEIAIPVELIAPVPPQQAQGDVAAPRPAPSQVPAPPTPDQASEPQRPQPVAPPPPPPRRRPPRPRRPHRRNRKAPRRPPPRRPRRACPCPPPPTPPAAQTPPPPVTTPPAPSQAALPPPPPPRPTPPTPTPPTPPQTATPPKPAAPQVAQAPPAPTPSPPRPNPAPPLPLPPSPTPPPPEPRQEPGTGQTPAVQRPQERSQSVLNTLERLRAAQQQQQPPTARANPAGAPAQGGGAPQGTDNLTAAERSGLAERIGECWSIDAGAPGVQNIVVELRVEVDAGGTVRAVRPNGAIPTEPRARMVYEAARRALLSPRCNPLPLPPARLAALRDTVFRFNPRDLGLR